ncbi:MAG: cytochrome c3 family protein [Deltaproteobacteria bacterium]|nr:cytochrome c3 family protein [Deltaproteobacteria bacterium]
MRTTLLRALLLALLLSAGPGRAEEGPVFSHADHIGREPDGPCTACHAVEAPKPTLKAERCIFCHDEDDTAPTRYRLLDRAKPLPLALPHERHAKEGDCRTCHARTVRDQLVQGEAFMPSSLCFDCHQERQVVAATDRCESCHGEGKRLTPPAGHRASSWMRRHGEASRWTGGIHGEDCALCHRADACQTCHQQRAPADHNGLWRLRGHGRVAAWDREGCKTCHESGQCVACHRSTQPLNHQGAWTSLHGAVAGDRENPSCLTCHRPTACVACHAGATP